MISVRIDPTLENELSLVAKEKGMSKSKYLRGLIIEKLETERVHKKTPWELGKHVFGKFDSGRSDLSKNRKAILKEKIREKACRH